MRRVIVYLVFLFSFIYSDKIILRDGREIDVRRVYIGDSLYGDTVTIPVDSVKSILFTEKGKSVEGRRYPFDMHYFDICDSMAKFYPDAKVVVLKDSGYWVLKRNGRRLYYQHSIVGILKEEGREEASVNLWVREEIENLRLILARNIKRDGRTFYVPKDGIRVLKPSEGVVFFSKGKYLSFTIPNVEVGDIVELIYEYEVFNPWNREIFEGGWYFQSTEPVYLSVLVVDVPSDDSLKFKSSDGVEFNHRKLDGYSRYVWRAEKLPPLVEEDMMPPIGNFLKKVEFTNQFTWDRIFDWYAGFQKPRMRVTERISSLVDSIVAGAKSEDERIARIYHWVEKNIRYISIKGAAASGVSGHSAEETLENGYGDCTDKAILFSTMLRAAGVEAYPVYVGTNDESPMLDPELPGYYGNHAITEVHKGDTTIYLDATGSFYRYPYFWSASHGVYMVNALRRDVSLIPVPSPENNHRDYTVRCELDRRNTLHVHFRGRYNGDIEANLRAYWVTRTEDEKRIGMENLVKLESPDAILDSFKLHNLDDISKQFGIEIYYRIKNYAREYGDIVMLKLPEVRDRYRFPELSTKEREFPINYQTSLMITHRVMIRIPQGMKVEYLPESMELGNDKFHYRAHFEFEKGFLYFEDRFERKGRLIMPEEYKEYKEFVRKINSYVNMPIILKEGR